MRYEEYAKKLADDYLKSGIVDGKNFPDIELYIDQMTKCLNQELRLYGDGKSTPITKAMISNYTKHALGCLWLFSGLWSGCRSFYR